MSRSGRRRRPADAGRGVLGLAAADTLFLHSLNLLGASLTAIVDIMSAPFIIGLYAGMDQRGHTLAALVMGWYVSLLLGLAGMKYTQALVAFALNQFGDVIVSILTWLDLKKEVTSQRSVGLALAVAATFMVVLGCSSPANSLSDATPPDSIKRPTDLISDLDRHVEGGRAEREVKDGASALDEPWQDAADADVLGPKDRIQREQAVEPEVDTNHPREFALSPSCPEYENAQHPKVYGLIYSDTDKSSLTMHHQEFYPSVDKPLSKVKVHLLGETDEVAAYTCDSGEFAFGSLPEGTYLVDVQMPASVDCTSTNDPIRLGNAVQEGEVTLVTIGDSIAVVGYPPLFHERLAKMLSPLAEVENINLAVSGSKSTDWLPGKGLFESKLLPHLPHADVVIVTLGGNDIVAWFGSALYDYGAMVKKIIQYPEFLKGLHSNIVKILTKIRELDPAVDIVYCLYFNYAYASYWQFVAGAWKGLVLEFAKSALNTARKNLGEIPNILVADMAGAMGETTLDPYLADSVHLSAKGHQFYAEQIFLVLGGVRVSAQPLGLNRLYGYDESGK